MEGVNNKKFALVPVVALSAKKNAVDKYFLAEVRLQELI